MSGGYGEGGYGEGEIWTDGDEPSPDGSIELMTSTELNDGSLSSHVYEDVGANGGPHSVVLPNGSTVQYDHHGVRQLTGGPGETNTLSGFEGGEGNAYHVRFVWGPPDSVTDVPSVLDSWTLDVTPGVTPPTIVDILPIPGLEYEVAGAWYDEVAVTDAGGLVAPDGSSVPFLRERLPPPPAERCNGWTASGSECGLWAGWGRGFDGDDGRNPGRCKYHWKQSWRKT